MFDAVVLGGGPAGCQCALWLRMLGFEVIIIEKEGHLGGLQSSSPYINNWIVGTIDLQGQEVARNMQKHIQRMKISVFFNNEILKLTKKTNYFELLLKDDLIYAKNIVIATGVNPSNGNFTKSQNVIIGPGKEVADFDFYNKDVAILGAGDNSAENYAFIAERNPKCCHIYGRTVRARRNLWEKVKEKDIFLGKYNADQKSMTIEYKGAKRNYNVFVVLYGWKANFPNAFLPFQKDLLSKHGFIVTDPFRRTKIPNIFAAGEVARCPSPCVVTAMADGIIAAKSIQAQLELTQTNKLFIN